MIGRIGYDLKWLGCFEGCGYGRAERVFAAYVGYASGFVTPPFVFCSYGFSLAC